MASRLFKTLLSGKSKTGEAGNEKRFKTTRLFSLKQSRWFTKEDSNLFNNVLESGNIIELRVASGNNGANVNKDSAATLEYGIVLWMSIGAQEEKQAVVIYLERKIEGDEDGVKRGMRYATVQSFWQDGTEIRINNMSDSEGTPILLLKIKERVNRASRGQYKWTESYSFVHWCRYGTPVPVEESSKKKQLQNAAVRWGNISASAGALLYLSKNQRK